jgi:hypothetical protein
MWLDRKAYEDQRAEGIKNHEEARVLAEQNRALQVTMDWFRVRINQLEIERAQLLFNYTGVKVSAPAITPAPAPDDPARAVPHFGDVGDEKAAALGIGWDENGEIKYSESK